MEINGTIKLLLLNILLWNLAECCFSRGHDDGDDSPSEPTDHDCLSANGVKGICTPLIHCAKLYYNYKKYIKYTCALSPEAQGICCPSKLDEDGDDDEDNEEEYPDIPKDMVPDEYDDKITITDDDFDAAWKAAEEKEAERERIEDELEKRKITLNQDAPALFHQNILKTYPEAFDLGKGANMLNLAAESLTSSLSLKPDLARGTLARYNLSNALQKYHLSCVETPTCKESEYRTVDGSCNNLEHGNWGRSFTSTQRLLKAQYSDGVNNPRLSKNGEPLPSPRLVSYTVMPDLFKPNPLITVFFPVFGQLLDHDMVITPASRGKNNTPITCCNPAFDEDPSLRHPECFQIEIPKDDPFYSQFNVTCMEFVRSLEAPRTACSLGPRQQMNQLTAFIDASFTYGSSENESKALRTFEKGKLKSSVCNGQEFMPFARPNQTCTQPGLTFKAGDIRVNEVTMLSMVQNLYLRMHNDIAEKFAEMNKHWDDETCYQEARKTVGAITQHIVYNEFLPSMLGYKIMKKFKLLPKDKGFINDYDANLNPTINNEFAAGSYRLHSTVTGNETYINEDGEIVETVPLKNSFGQPQRVVSPGKLDDLIRGVCTDHAQKFDNYVSKQLTSHLFQGGGKFGLDLAAININRGRDHGLGTYNQFREICGLKPADSFDSLKKLLNKHAAERFEKVYTDVDDIDMWAAGTSEKPLRGAVVGPLFACISGEQFRRLKYGDRFFYENADQKSSFSKGQLKAIKNMNLARIVCDYSDNIKRIQPLAFRKVDEYNKVTSCDSIAIPSLDLSSWKDEK